MFLVSIMICGSFFSQEKAKSMLPPIRVNSLYLQNTVTNGIEHFNYTYKNKRLIDGEYSIIVKFENVRVTKKFVSETGSSEGNDLARIKSDLSKGKATGVIMTGYFEGGYKNGLWKATYDKNLIKTENFKCGLTIGLYKVYNKNGNILYNTTFGPEGNGTYKDFYFKTGFLKQEGRYKNGKREGEWRRYDEDGKLTSVQVYHAGIPRIKE